MYSCEFKKYVPAPARHLLHHGNRQMRAPLPPVLLSTLRPLQFPRLGQILLRLPPVRLQCRLCHVGSLTERSPRQHGEAMDRKALNRPGRGVGCNEGQMKEHVAMAKQPFPSHEAELDANEQHSDEQRQVQAGIAEGRPCEAQGEVLPEARQVEDALEERRAAFQPPLESEGVKRKELEDEYVEAHELCGAGLEDELRLVNGSESVTCGTGLSVS